MSTTTLGTQVPAPVNVVLMRGLLTQARKVLPFMNGTIPGQLEKNQGSLTVKWRKFDDLAVATSALAEITTESFGMGRTAAQATVTDITKAVSKYGNPILYTEELDLVNINSRAAQLMDVLGRNAGESLNVLAQTEFSAATNIVYSNGASVAAVNTVMDASAVKLTVNGLNNADAMKFTPLSSGSTTIGSSPIRSAYYGICHVDVEEDIRLIAGFKGVEEYASHASDIQVGEFGAVGGVRWISTSMSQLVTANGGTTGGSNVREDGGGSGADTYESYVYGKEAVGTIGLGENHTEEIYQMGDKLATVEVIKKEIGSSGVADMLDEVGSVAWKAWFAAKVLNQSWIRKTVTAASDLS